MTSREIMDFIGGRGDKISRADLSRLNEMLIDLPIEEVSDVRGWIMESIAMTVSDPVYDGDIVMADIER